MYIVFRHFTEYVHSVEIEKNKIWVAWYHAILFGFFFNKYFNKYTHRENESYTKTNKQTNPIYTLFWDI